MKPLPRHGTRARKRAFNCQCTACVAKKLLRKEGRDIPLRWSSAPLFTKFGTEMLSAWYDPEQIRAWKSDGLTDEETDRVAITLGFMPWQIWGGWIEAGLDYKAEEEDSERHGAA